MFDDKIKFLARKVLYSNLIQIKKREGSGRPRNIRIRIRNTVKKLTQR
jgi:hypothetical protein